MGLTFLGLPNREDARVALIPAPLELTTSWKKGTNEAPVEILKVSVNMEFFDDEFFINPAEELGFYTYPVKELPFDLEKALKLVAETVKHAVNLNRFPVVIGGEHTVSFSPVSVLKEFYPELKVLHLDAHLDLRDTYLGTPLNHATVIRRIKELGIPVLSLGIRSICEEEYNYIKNYNHPVIWARECFFSFKEVLEKVEDFLKDSKVYLTLDIDVLDPGIAPGTGTPEPGGLSWYQILEVLKLVAKYDLVGMDLVEVSPTFNPAITEYIAAKLLFKLATYLAVKKKNA